VHVVGHDAVGEDLHPAEVGDLPDLVAQHLLLAFPLQEELAPHDPGYAMVDRPDPLSFYPTTPHGEGRSGGEGKRSSIY